MAVDWSNFTPLSALAGGGLIGLAAAWLLVFEGRIAGVSGIVGGLMQRQGRDERNWRGAFVLGLLSAVPLWAIVRPLPSMQPQATWGLLLGAGLLVGFGARLGGGCTSGHGVCGIARGARRSLVATAVFMGVAIATHALLTKLRGVS
ncbi:YeeE/YedE family protein [Xanthomonas dyei]|uniref:YeeE/YedE family protein n=1 Tax=Xanthomonas dyei TaxID=743699 RepID=UPI0032E86543